MKNELAGRVALVTGASRGLGASIAIRLAEHGAKVAINFASHLVGAQEVRQKIFQCGGVAEVFQADITEEKQVESLHTSILNTLGSVDILVANATGPQPDKNIEELDWQDMLDQLEFFVKSPMLLAQQVVPEMKRRGYGRIINIGSEAFTLGTPGCSAYVAAKGAQLGLTRSWARELGRFGITVNLLAPGWVQIKGRDEFIAQEMVQRYTASVPMGFRGEVEDVAAVVVFLASKGAQFITGQSLAVNGGNTIS